MNYIRKDLYIKTVLGALKCDNGYELLLQDKTIVSEKDWSSKRDFQEWCTEYDRYVPDEHKIAIPKGRYILYGEDASGIFLAPIEDFVIKTYNVSYIFDEKVLCPIIVPDNDQWDEIIEKETGQTFPKSIIHPFSNYIFWDVLSDNTYDKCGEPYINYYNNEIEEYNRKDNRTPYYVFWGKHNIYVGKIYKTIDVVEKNLCPDSIHEQINTIVHYLLHCDVDKEIDAFSIVSDDYIAQPPGKDHSYWEYKIYKHVEDEYIDTLFPHDKIETDHYRECVIPLASRHGEKRCFLEEEKELKDKAKKKYSKEEHFKYLINKCIQRFKDKEDARELGLYSSLLTIIQSECAPTKTEQI